MKYEEVYLKAYASVLEAQKGLEDYFRFYNGLRPHQALGYRTPAEVFHGDQGVVEGDSNGRRCSPGQGIESLAGESGFSLNSALIPVQITGSTSAFLSTIIMKEFLPVTHLLNRELICGVRGWSNNLVQQ